MKTNDCEITVLYERPNWIAMFERHENGNYWVAELDNTYTVFKTGITHSTSIQSFKRDSDGLSNAIAYCDYLAKRRLKND